MSTCTRCHSAIEADDLRCAVCAAPTPHVAHRVTTQTVTVLRCTGCGAAVSYDAERRAPHCGFCGATMKLEQTADPLQQADHALPFGLDETRARDVLNGFLASGGFFHPGDLATASSVSAMQPLFWAGWLFDAEADVSYTTDSNYGNGRSAWAPHAGVTRMHFDRIVVSASRGLSETESQPLVPGYDLSTARSVAEIDALGPHSATVERFELERSAARKVIANAISNMAEGRVTSGIAPGSSFRNTHVSLVLRGLATRRLLFPVWILTYRYGDKPYRVVVHGQRNDIVVGSRPLSVARVLAVVLAVGLALFVVLAILANL